MSQRYPPNHLADCKSLSHGFLDWNARALRKIGGKDPMLPAAAPIESAASVEEGGASACDLDDEEDLESYDLDLLEQGAVVVGSDVGVEEAQRIALRLTRLVFASEPVASLFKAAITHVMRWLRRTPQALGGGVGGGGAEGVKEASVRAAKEQLRGQAISTYAALAIAHLRCGLLPWADLEPQVRLLKMPLESGSFCTYVAFFSALLEEATTKLGGVDM